MKSAITNAASVIAYTVNVFYITGNKRKKKRKGKKSGCADI